MTNNSTDRIILALLNLEGVGRKTARKIATALLRENDVPESLGALLEKATEQKLIRTQYGAHDIEMAVASAAAIEEDLRGIGGSFASFMNLDYPMHLEAIADPPALIFYKGNAALFDANFNIGVIGTRAPSNYVSKVGDRAVEILVKAGYAIVSGLALGCDTIAHRGALNHNGKTIAVLPSGFLSIYPKTNQALAAEILDHEGLWVSEYFPAASPLKNHFVERDRLQSALSRALFVLETDIDGGTMHTVRFARKENKPIACLLTHPPEYLSAPSVQGNWFIEKEKWGLAIRDKKDFDNFLLSLKESPKGGREGEALQSGHENDSTPPSATSKDAAGSGAKGARAKRHYHPDPNQFDLPF